MSVEFSVPLSQIAEALNLTEVYVAENYKETNISTVEINRPGLELTGYLEFFDNKRIQVLGNTEFSYLGRYGPEAQKMVIDSIFSFGPPAVIICRDIEPSNAILESAKLHKVSIFSTPQSTSDLTASLVQYLNKELEENPKNAYASTLLAMAYFKEQDYSTSLSLINKIHPNHVFIYAVIICSHVNRLRDLKNQKMNRRLPYDQAGYIL